jgi:hypothetical protein
MVPDALDELIAIHVPDTYPPVTSGANKELVVDTETQDAAFVDPFHFAYYS